MTDTAGRTAQVLLIAASTMLFASFTSAMVVRRAIGPDWISPQVPAWIWLTAPLVVAASIAARRCRYRVAAAAAAGLLALQIAWIAALRLSIIADAFLAVLAGAHALHIAGAMLALIRFRQGAELFWHFAAALWLYILLLFGVWA